VSIFKVTKSSIYKNMTNKYPVMPKATAVWLVENTSLTFKQIAEFSGMHELEIKGIADGEVAQGIIGINPVTSGQVSKEDIELCTKNPNSKLKLKTSDIDHFIKKKSKARYTPVARRQDKPDAIFWLLKQCPNIPDSKIVKLIGTTKSTILSIREKTHWNIKNMKPRDPVLLGLSTQTELDKILEIYKDKSEERAHD
jgi:uncharacterized protein